MRDMTNCHFITIKTTVLKKQIKEEKLRDNEIIYDKQSNVFQMFSNEDNTANDMLKELLKFQLLLRGGDGGRLWDGAIWLKFICGPIYFEISNWLYYTHHISNGMTKASDDRE